MSGTFVIIAVVHAHITLCTVNGYAYIYLADFAKYLPILRTLLTKNDVGVKRGC